MTATTPSALDLAVEINRVTAGTGVSSCSLDELWAPISVVVPFEAAWMGVFDTGQNRYQTLTAVGHDAVNRAYLESSDFNEQVEAFELFRRTRPLCLRDVPVPPAEIPSWAERWWPAGYREGIGVPLVARDGRRLGVMTMFTDSPARPSDAARDVIGVIAPMISAAIDPMTTIAGLAALVGDARAGGVVGRDGTVCRLPGMPVHPLLFQNSRVVRTALAKLTQRKIHTAFLWPDPYGRDDYVRITAIACPPQAPNYFIALILVSPQGDLLGLTHRELEVLGFIIDGRTNQSIAHALFITERTVAAHMEHIRAKLDAPTRTVAAVRSLHLALYLPPQPTDVAE
ncbi:LuxR C-terminal-related transcriptional regulator [Actinoplanes sp. NPDC049118]|uniref:LuxR C-terminal-related transcriptional regulator n=1 Tax=Actinoplanes sp. NPDC049118 TaxID=3155769 RepID=UPI0033C8FA7E